MEKTILVIAVTNEAMASAAANPCIEYRPARIEFGFEHGTPVIQRIAVAHQPLQGCIVPEIGLQGIFGTILHRALRSYNVCRTAAGRANPVGHVNTHPAMVHQGGDGVVLAVDGGRHGGPLVGGASKIGGERTKGIAVV